MVYEIHVYLGVSCIAKGAKYEYPEGEKHPIMLFIREQKNSEYNESKAKQIVKDLSLNSIEFSKCGKVSFERIKSDEQKNMYKSALEIGSALVLYSDPVI